jgi:sulfite reductase (ferredoxin)
VYVEDLPDYVERVVRRFVADRAEGQTFAEWAHAADEEALQ